MARGTGVPASNKVPNFKIDSRRISVCKRLSVVCCRLCDYRGVGFQKLGYFYYENWGMRQGEYIYELIAIENLKN